jgi:hypothetical protein
VHGEKEGRRGGEELKKKKRDWKLFLKSGSVTAASFFPPLSLFRLSSLWLLSPSLPSLSLSTGIPPRPGRRGRFFKYPLLWRALRSLSVHVQIRAKR